MSWTRLDDMWTEMSELEPLDFPDRWHYLCMIQHCSRAGKIDGVMRLVDARRCSDHPAPDEAIQNLTGAGLLQSLGNKVQVNRIDDHIPPPSVRNRTEVNRINKRRQRKHHDGDHSMCLPKHCDYAPSTPVTDDVTCDSKDDPRTGQDRTGQDLEEPTSEVLNTETGEITSSSASSYSQIWDEPHPLDSPSVSSDDFDEFVAQFRQPNRGAA